MFNVERHEHIIRILEERKSMSVKKLSEMLYVSEPTVRRDLSVLENEGRVVRTHGGVILVKGSETEIPLILRESQNNSHKRAIAEKAAELVKSGDVIFMDASSTVSYLIPFLTKFKNIIVVTNSPKTSVKLGEAGIKNYCTGGLLLANSVAYIGSDAERFVRSVNADIFFFSSRGISNEGEITDSSAEESAVKRAMSERSNQVYFLCDSSKIGKKYMYKVCNASDIDGVITE